MSAVNIIIQALLSKPAVTAIVSDRVTMRPLPTASALPAITVYLVSDVEGYTLAGATGYPESRVTVECLAKTGPAADILGEAVRGALKDFRGTIAGKNATIFKEGTDAADNEENQPVYRRHIDFIVRWRDA